MTEVPGTDRDQARENALSEVPITPEGIEPDDDHSGDEGATGDDVKPTPGSTEPLP
ncbi:hypothetical protein [Blastococcus sp. SYSU D00820]